MTNNEEIIMDDTDFEIPGLYKIDEINSSIANKEAGAWEFRSIRVTNIATFRKLPPGKLSEALEIVKQGDPQPPGTQSVWSGEMVVEGNIITVTAYRKV
jgi:hypothetical protein